MDTNLTLSDSSKLQELDSLTLNKSRESRTKSARIFYQSDQVEKERIEKDRKIPIKEKEAGYINEIKDKKIDLLIKDYNKEKVIKGYRIQLFVGSSKVEAMKVKANFLSKNESEVPEVIYQSPNFKVRVGNYRNRLHANQMLNQYKDDFPAAFIVQDELDVSALFK